MQTHEEAPRCFVDVELNGNYESLLAPRKQALDLSIAKLYEVFGDYPLRPVVQGCDHCVFPEDNDLIHSLALKRLGARELSKFSYKALTTWGDADDLRHFLPRLLELVTTDETVGGIDTPILFGKLRYAGWRQWPEKEQEALLRFFETYWPCMLAEYPVRLEDGESALAGIANAVDDIRPFLAGWLKQEGAPPVLHLARFVVENSANVKRRGVLRDAFWEDCGEQVSQVIGWMKSRELADHLGKMFFVYENSEPYLAALLSFAGSELEPLAGTDMDIAK
jgi:hypothetical protein